MSDRGNAPARTGVSAQDLAVGLAILLLAAVVAWQTTIIPENAVYAKVGPKVFPWLSAAMLAVMGGLLVWQGLNGGWEHDEGGATDWRSLGWLLGGLALNLALIQHAGFIIASTLLFACVARAFGSGQPLRDVTIGFLVASISYVGFDKVLGYKIGSGLVERLIERVL
jgi:putative tricarboxylic transport membrane protein